MMRLITEYDVKMTKELAKWSVYPEDDTGRICRVVFADTII